MIARHDEFSEVLGAYALDAVDPDEAAAIEDHLRTCALCAREVSEHREIAALLTRGSTTAPQGVWDRIALELSPPPPAMRMTLAVEPPVAPVVVLPSGGEVRTGRRRTVPVRVFAGALAVAACLLAVVGAITWDQSRRIDRMEAALITTAPATPGPGEVDVRLTGGGGDLTAQAVVDRRGVGHLYAADLPALPDGDVYQLWGKVDGTLLSLGAFGSGSDVVTFQIDPQRLGAVEAFAVTQERSPGVVTSTQDALVAGTV